LRAAAEREPIKSLKRESYALLGLREGARVLDVGCGPGIDTIAMAELVGRHGFVAGIDPDPMLVRIAEVDALTRGVADHVKHRVGVGTALPYPTASFDAARCERVLQHLVPGDAARVIREMFRVTSAGGRCVIIDTDWASLSIHSDDYALERLLVAMRALAWRNGFAARALAEHIARAGGVASPLRIITLPLGPAEIRFFLQPMLLSAVGLGWVDAGRAAAWLPAVERNAELGWHYASVNLLTFSATRQLPA